LYRNELLLLVDPLILIFHTPDVIPNEFSNSLDYVRIIIFKTSNLSYGVLGKMVTADCGQRSVCFLRGDAYLCQVDTSVSLERVGRTACVLYDQIQRHQTCIAPFYTRLDCE